MSNDIIDLAAKAAMYPDKDNKDTIDAAGKVTKRCKLCGRSHCDADHALRCTSVNKQHYIMHNAIEAATESCLRRGFIC